MHGNKYEYFLKLNLEEKPKCLILGAHYQNSLNVYEKNLKAVIVAVSEIVVSMEQI